MPSGSHHSQFLCHIRCPAHLQFHPRCPRILLLHTLTSQRKLTNSDKDSAVDTQSVCTHTRVAHFSVTLSLRGVQTSRTRVAQGVCSAHVTSLHLTLSILMFHPPSLPFPHDHFDTSFLSAPSLPNCSRIRKRGSGALPHERWGVWPPGRSHALHRL